MNNSKQVINYLKETFPKGMVVDVIKSSYNSTNGGITSQKDRLLLIGDNVPELDDIRDFKDSEILYLDTMYLGSEKTIYKRVFPIEYASHFINNDETRIWFKSMFGGNFIYSSDSRFNEKVCQYPLKVLDRIEAPKPKPEFKKGSKVKVYNVSLSPEKLKLYKQNEEINNHDENRSILALQVINLWSNKNSEQENNKIYSDFKKINNARIKLMKLTSLGCDYQTDVVYNKLQLLRDFLYKHVKLVNYSEVTV